jgi:hypothetical protein
VVAHNHDTARAHDVICNNTSQRNQKELLDNATALPDTLPAAAAADAGWLVHVFQENWPPSNSATRLQTSWWHIRSRWFTMLLVMHEGAAHLIFFRGFLTSLCKPRSSAMCFSPSEPGPAPAYRAVTLASTLSDAPARASDGGCNPFIEAPLPATCGAQWMWAACEVHQVRRYTGVVAICLAAALCVRTEVYH